MISRFQQKLTVPRPARRTLERSELIDRLNSAVTTKSVTVLAAPAGWGKTTTLSHWSAQSTIPTFWYTLDASDISARQFLHYLIEMLEDELPEAQQLLIQMSAGSAVELPGLFELVAAAIAEIQQPLAIVLDDFHLIHDGADPLIFSLLASIAEYAANCHLVYASRTIPAIHGMARLIAQHRAAVFDYTALQFSSSEVQQLAGLTTGVLLSDTTAEQLTEQLGGWVTGIVLSLDQTRNTPSRRPIEFGRSIQHQAGHSILSADPTRVYDFLAEQVIEPLPRALQEFLEATSVLDLLSVRRCDELLQAHDSAVWLDEIVQRGLFVTSRGDDLAFHALFRDFLRARLAKDPQRYRHLLRRTGDIYMAEEAIELAIESYLAADDSEAACRALRNVVSRFRRSSRQNVLLQCFDRLTTYAESRSQLLPTDLLIAQARVCSDVALWDRARVALNVAFATGNNDQRLEAQLLDASIYAIIGEYQYATSQLNGIDQSHLSDHLQLSYLLTRGRVLVGTSQLSEAIAALEQANALASTAQSIDELIQLGSIYDLLGFALTMNGNRDAALRNLQRADACWQAIGNAGRRTMTLNNLGIIAVQEGRLPIARGAFETGLQIARQAVRRRETVILLNSLADLDLIEGQVDKAREVYAEALELAVQTDLNAFAAYAAAGLAWLAALDQQNEQVHHWTEVIERYQRGGYVLTEDIDARLIVAQTFTDARRENTDWQQIQERLDRIERVKDLGPTEYATIALLRGLAHTKLRSAAVAGLWQRFAAMAAGLPQTILTRLLNPFVSMLQSIDQSWLTGATAQALASFEPHGPRWVVRTCGAFMLQAEAQTYELSSLHRTMLVRILDAGSAGLSVEQLWRDVWNDDYPSLPAVHQAMYRLRNVTKLSVVIRNGLCVVKTPATLIDYDVRALEELLNEKNPGAITIEHIRRHYQGDFMPDIELKWFAARRTQLRQRVTDVYERYAMRTETSDPGTAIRSYQSVLQIDACREQSAARLMQLAARFGDQALLQTTYEQLNHSLRSIGTQPSTSTTSLYRQLRQH